MENREKTRKKLLNHFKTYPGLQIQDVFKFLHQSAFGCEHLISSPEKAIGVIADEYQNLCQNKAGNIEPLDGEYSRVPLSYIRQGLSADTFGKLFFSSAIHEQNGLTNLVEKLKTAKELVCEGLLPFSREEFEKAEKAWEEKGYPAVHHSDLFRETYHPSYRVISNRFIPFLPLFCEIDQRNKNGKTLIAVEGGSASGKTTLGKLLTSVYGCTLFHMDDFFLQPSQRTAERYNTVGGNVDWERFLTEILKPLKSGGVIQFRKFDCSSMSLAEAVEISPENLVIVEGAYSMHPELEKYYDFSVFLDVSPALQRERILKRNGPQTAKRFFAEWIPLEQTYFEKTNIRQRCDLSISIAEE